MESRRDLLKMYDADSAGGEQTSEGRESIQNMATVSSSIGDTTSEVDPTALAATEVTHDTLLSQARNETDSNSDQLFTATDTSSVVGSPCQPSTSQECAQVNNNTSIDLNMIKERIIEQKYLDLLNLKERHPGSVAELYYLQSGGNMMDYLSWSNEPVTSDFVTFFDENRLDQLQFYAYPANIYTGYPLEKHSYSPTFTLDIALEKSSLGWLDIQPILQAAGDFIAILQSNIMSNTTFVGETSPASASESDEEISSRAIDGRNLAAAVRNSEQPQDVVLKSTAGVDPKVAESTKVPGSEIQTLQPSEVMTDNIIGGTTTSSGSVGGTNSRNVIASAETQSQGTGFKIPATPTTACPNLPVYEVQSGQPGKIITEHVLSDPTTSSGAVGGTNFRNVIVKGETQSQDTVFKIHATPATACPNLPVSEVQSAQPGKIITEHILSGPPTSSEAVEGTNFCKTIASTEPQSRDTIFKIPVAPAAVSRKLHVSQLQRNQLGECGAQGSKEMPTFDRPRQDDVSRYSSMNNAQMEIYVLQRISKLKWEGLWTADRLPKQEEPKRIKTHWDYCIDEVLFMAVDFASERNWKKKAAKRIVYNAQKFVLDKDFAAAEKAAKAEKAQKTQLKSIAAAMSKAVLKFWSDVRNIVEQKNRLQFEEKRDTENFSQLAEDMGETVTDAASTSIALSRISPDKRETAHGSVGKDVSKIQEENIQLKVNKQSVNEENTCSKQEEEKMGVDHQKEINVLNADENLGEEQLLETYYRSGKVNEPLETAKTRNGIVVDSDDDDDSSNNSNNCNDEVSEDSSSVSEMETSSGESEGEEQEESVKSIFEVGCSSKENVIKQSAALAHSLQPKGNMLSSANVTTPVPFLLKHSLREYQHVGFNWLVAMDEHKLNCILADESGLGKTIQTIALIAHLACVKGNWGPHLIVVTSSILLKWELEFKKWCPGLKILTYYGTQRTRKMKRVAWTKPNAFHVCITSYKFVVQDQKHLCRIKWKYLILDEAQNIKDFMSQRWQILLKICTERRLLLTATPLSNDFMEMLSLLYLLMPYKFCEYSDFKELFSNPVTCMIGGDTENNETLISGLHKLIRPFLLHRLQKEVAEQLPKKHEHYIMCRLTNRQQKLYDDVMSSNKTKETLKRGKCLSIINVLMQLRKVSNHPNLVEEAPIISPFQMEGITYRLPRLVYDLLEYDPLRHIDFNYLNLLLIELELTLTAYASYKRRFLAPEPSLMEEIDSILELPPPCPRSDRYKYIIRIRRDPEQQNLSRHNTENVRFGTSPAMKVEGNKLVPISNIDSSKSKIAKRLSTLNPVNVLSPLSNSVSLISPNNSENTLSSISFTQTHVTPSASLNSSAAPKKAKLAPGEPNMLVSAASTSSDAQRLVHKDSTISSGATSIPSPQQLKMKIKYCTNSQRENLSRLARLKVMAINNEQRLQATPIYGEDCCKSLENLLSEMVDVDFTTWQTRSYRNCCLMMKYRDWPGLNTILKSYEKRVEEFQQVFRNFVVFIPAAYSPRIQHYAHHTSAHFRCERKLENTISRYMAPKLTLLYPIISRMRIKFPHLQDIQYDCGKLQILDCLLRQLKRDHRRVLIFTQMTEMLDVLESFVCYHGYIYLRLDVSMCGEQRRFLIESFNFNKEIFCFILSTRSGGININLTGADAAIFYDTDWNPTMYAQAQYRCSRIGQTRDAHIYTLLSEKTVEVNIFNKANRQRMFNDMANKSKSVTNIYFKKSTIKDLFDVEQLGQDLNLVNATPTDAENTSTTLVSKIEEEFLSTYERALAEAEDERDVQAMVKAKAEATSDFAEFDEKKPMKDIDVQITKADLEMHMFLKKLSPIQHYAIRVIEESGNTWTAEQQQVTKETVEARKLQWEANHWKGIAAQKEKKKVEDDASEELLTYSGVDARNKTWVSHNSTEEMPILQPFDIPEDGEDIYIDHSLGFMYEQHAMSESELPPVYVPKNRKRSRAEAGLHLDGNQRIKTSRKDSCIAPATLFNRPTPSRTRRLFNLNTGRRCNLRPNEQPRQRDELEGMAEWSFFEDITILDILVNLQGFRSDLTSPSAGRAPNWNLVSEVVNFYCKTYRTPRQCRCRYEMVILPREMGKLVETRKKQTRLSAKFNLEYFNGPLHHFRTTHMYCNDTKDTVIDLMYTRFNNIKRAYFRKPPPLRRPSSKASLSNPKHLEMLQGFGILNYDQPKSPLELAEIKWNRMCRKPCCQAGVEEEEMRIVSSMLDEHKQPEQVANVVQHQTQELVEEQQQQNVAVNTVTTAVQPITSMQTQLEIQQIPSGKEQDVLKKSTTTPGELQVASSLSKQQTTISTTSLLQLTCPTSISNDVIGATQVVKPIMTQESGSNTAEQMQPLAKQAATTSTLPKQQQQFKAGRITQTLPSSGMSNENPQGESCTIQIISFPPDKAVPSSTSNNTAQPSEALPQLCAIGTVQRTAEILQPNVKVIKWNPSTVQVKRIVAPTKSSMSDRTPQQHGSNTNRTIFSKHKFTQAATKVPLQGGATQPYTSKANSTIVPISNLRQNIAARLPAATTISPQGGVSQRRTIKPNSAIVSTNNLAHNVPVRYPALSAISPQRRINKPSSTIVPISNSGQNVVTTTAGSPNITVPQKCVNNPSITVVTPSNLGENFTSQPQSTLLCIGSTKRTEHQSAPQPYHRRQQLQVLQATPTPDGYKLVQTTGEKTTLASANSMIIQGSLVQKDGRQATMQVRVEKVASPNIAIPMGASTSAAAMQVAYNDHVHGTKQVDDHQTIVSHLGKKMNVLEHQYEDAQQVKIFNTDGTGSFTVQQQQRQSIIVSGGQRKQQSLVKVQPRQQLAAQQTALSLKPSGSRSNIQQASSSSGSVTVSTGGAQTQGNVNLTFTNLQPVTTSRQNQSGSRQLYRRLLPAQHKFKHMTQIPTKSPGKVSVDISTANQQISKPIVQKPKCVSSGPTQVVPIKNTTLQTKDQVQPLMMKGQRGSPATLVPINTGGGRGIPESVSVLRSNQRQTMQMLPTTSSRALVADNLRSGITINSVSANQTQESHATQSSRRQNIIPVRLQTTPSGNLVVVIPQNTAASSIGEAGRPTTATASLPAIGSIIPIPQNLAATIEVNQQQQEQSTAPPRVCMLIRKNPPQQSRERDC